MKSIESTLRKLNEVADRYEGEAEEGFHRGDNSGAFAAGYANGIRLAVKRIKNVLRGLREDEPFTSHRDAGRRRRR